MQRIFRGIRRFESKTAQFLDLFACSGRISEIVDSAWSESIPDYATCPRTGCFHLLVCEIVGFEQALSQLEHQRPLSLEAEKRGTTYPPTIQILRCSILGLDESVAC